MHWVCDFLGKPHVPGARGPEAFDCWGLLRFVYQSRFDIELPLLPGVSEASARRIVGQIQSAMADDWDEIEKPFDGCGVAMSQSQAYHHVGLYMEADGAKVLHCWDGAQVVLDTLPRLRLKGLKKITFYRHRLWPTS